VHQQADQFTSSASLVDVTLLTRTELHQGPCLCTLCILLIVFCATPEAPIMSAALDAVVPGVEPDYRSAGAALASCSLFTQFYPSKSTQAVQLDMKQLLGEAAAVDSSGSSGSSSSITNRYQQGALSDDDHKLEHKQQHMIQQEQQQVEEEHNQEQQQQQVTHIRPAANAVMPLPEQLQLLSSVTAEQCAAAEIVILQGQRVEELSDMLQHVAAAGLVAMDCEFSFNKGSSGSSSSSISSSDEDSELLSQDAQAKDKYIVGMGGPSQLPPSHNAAQQHYPDTSCWQLALVQLMVPAVTTPDGTWPSHVYLVRVPRHSARAQAVLKQLKEVLKGAEVIKVVHDGRLVG
jgi:hypothetical protein